MLNLFATLELERGLQCGKSVGRLGGKLVREIKALESSVNYDFNASSSRRSRNTRDIVNVL